MYAISYMVLAWLKMLQTLVKTSVETGTGTGNDGGDEEQLWNMCIKLSKNQLESSISKRVG